MQDYIYKIVGVILEYGMLFFLLYFLLRITAAFISDIREMRKQRLGR